MFEWSNEKSKENFKKHGISFCAAKELWRDPHAQELKAKSTEDEERFLIIGKMNKKLWSAIFTYRELKIRIISVRRSRKNEGDYYESKRIR